MYGKFCFADCYLQFRNKNFSALNNIHHLTHFDLDTGTG